MYRQHTDFSQPTPNLPKTNPQSTSPDNSRNSSPQSSLPCGQRTPAASTSSSDAPSSPTPPQTFTTSHQPQFPTKTQHTSPSLHKQHTPSKTNIDQSSQSSIAGEDQQRVPKSADGTQVKRSKHGQDSQLSAFAFTAICLVILRDTVPKFPIVLNVGQKDTHRTDVSTGHRRPDIHIQLVNSETSRRGRTISHSFQAVTISVCSVQEITRPPTVHDHSHHLLILLLLVQVSPRTNMHLVLHAHLLILIRIHLAHIVNLHFMYGHPLST